MKRRGKNYLITFCAKILIVCGVLISPGCAALGDIAIGVTGHVIGDMIVKNKWFDTRLHFYTNTFQSENACNLFASKLDKKTGRVCVPKNNHSGQIDLYTTK